MPTGHSFPALPAASRATARPSPAYGVYIWGGTPYSAHTHIITLRRPARSDRCYPAVPRSDRRRPSSSLPSAALVGRKGGAARACLALVDLPTIPQRSPAAPQSRAATTSAALGALNAGNQG